MVKRIISMNGITDVTKMVTLAMVCDGDIIISSGRYAVDAKSILGIFSLDLSKPIELQIFSDDNAEIEKFMADIAPFLA